MAKYRDGFKAKFKDDLYTGSMISIFDVLTGAMAQAKSTDPVKVAAAMHGYKFKGFNGDMEMRKLDHQLQQTLYVTVWQKADKKYPYSPENTGMTLAPVKTFEPYVSSTPTSCQMKTP
jgi:branched-chain amino acid transport system substrate-binding protein